ncbi:MAG: hypothetical protein QM504_10335 [Pseudomonadota bacterium]
MKILDLIKFKVVVFVGLVGLLYGKYSGQYIEGGICFLVSILTLEIIKVRELLEEDKD